MTECETPAVVEVGNPETVKDVALPGFKVNELLVPVFEEPDVPTVIPVPD